MSFFSKENIISYYNAKEGVSNTYIRSVFLEEEGRRQ